MHTFRLSDGVQQLIHEVQAKMTVLQEHPASLEYVHVCGYACVEIWQYKFQSFINQPQPSMFSKVFPSPSYFTHSAHALLKKPPCMHFLPLTH